MSERDALFAAILAHPDEDTPRLMFADWLDEQGSENDKVQARFIRVQIEIARRQASDPCDPEIWRLRKQEGRLLTHANHQLWSQWLHDRLGETYKVRMDKDFNSQMIEFRRGFPYGIEATEIWLLDHHLQLDGIGVIQDLSVQSTRPIVLGNILNYPFMRHIVSLYNNYHPHPHYDYNWADVVQAPNVPKLKTLIFQGAAGENDLTGFARLPFLNQLEAMTFSVAGRAGVPAALNTLLGNLAKSKIKSLGVFADFDPYQPIPFNLSGIVGNSTVMGQLEYLGVGGGYTQQPGTQIIAYNDSVEHFTHTPNLSGLKRLYLSGPLDDRGMAAIAGCRGLRNLTSFRTADTVSRGVKLVTRAGAETLAASSVINKLTHLGIGRTSCGIGRDGARAIAGSANFANLVSADLSSNEIGNDGAKALANSPHLSKVMEIDLRHNGISAKGAIPFRSGHWKKDNVTVIGLPSAGRKK